MANPIEFKPRHVDPQVELQRRLEAAPNEHAEALLVLFDLIQTAHDQGLLDTAHGLVSAKDTIFGKLAEYAKLPEGVAGIRNLLSVAQVMMSIDPEAMSCLARAVSVAVVEHKKEERPPSLWQLAKRATSEDSRKGMSFMMLMLAGIGRSLGK
jgi:uncharacterized protein YjgD (DUF1641 family)